MSRFLIAMDIDDTQVRDRALYPNISDEDKARIQELDTVLSSARRDGAIVFHVTGGILPDFEKFKSVLPKSDYLSCAAATELYKYDSHSGLYIRDEGFEAMLDSLVFLEDAATGLNDHYNQLTPLLGEHKNPYKISFIIDPTLSLDDATSLVKDISGHLKDHKDMRATLVHTEATNYLDITPRICTKGDKVEYIARLHDITPDHVIVFGNGGNDISMFRHEFKGVAVGNAGSSLKNHVLSTSQAGAQHIVAEKHYAHGVIEGLTHFGVVR